MELRYALLINSALPSGLIATYLTAPLFFTIREDKEDHCNILLKGIATVGESCSSFTNCTVIIRLGLFRQHEAKHHPSTRFNEVCFFANADRTTCVACRGHCACSSGSRQGNAEVGGGGVAHGEFPGVDRHRLGGVVRLVDAHQPVCQFKHVVAQADDHELRVLGPLLDVVRHDGHVLEVCRAAASCSGPQSSSV